MIIARVCSLSGRLLFGAPFGEFNNTNNFYNVNNNGDWNNNNANNTNGVSPDFCKKAEQVK